jgi:hypothetical protein
MSSSSQRMKMLLPSSTGRERESVAISDAIRFILSFGLLLTPILAAGLP